MFNLFYFLTTQNVSLYLTLLRSFSRERDDVVLMTVNSCLEPTSFKDATFEQLKTVVRFVRDSSTFFLCSAS